MFGEYGKDMYYMLHPNIYLSALSVVYLQLDQKPQQEKEGFCHCQICSNPCHTHASIKCSLLVLDRTF